MFDKNNLQKYFIKLLDLLYLQGLIEPSGFTYQTLGGVEAISFTHSSMLA